jgi:hypothetical protein
LSHELKLGQLLGPEAGRDAVHVAIAPVVAAEVLQPGQRIEFAEDGDYEKVKGSRQHYEGLGIVDPFLRNPVQVGQRFYIWLTPNTIKSLRHVWVHPAFPLEKPPHVPESEEWLRAYAVEHNPYDNDPEVAYQRLIRGLREHELYFHGNDLHGFYELPDPEELRRHAEAVLGFRIDWQDYMFTCSC